MEVDSNTAQGGKFRFGIFILQFCFQTCENCKKLEQMQRMLCTHPILHGHNGYSTEGL